MKFTYPSGSRPLDGFTIKRGIGIGGFGEVYFATTDAGKEVALKRIQRNLDIELRGVTQCLNLKHPNLVVLFDIRYDGDGEAWVVMEYVAGESLKDVIEQHPHGLPRDRVDHWFRGIAAGVAYLHDHGIVHRDLKPANIFDDGGVVKIGDYGLSKFISCSRRSGQTESVGTFHYMAPEIGKGVYGKEIDIYALGIILHEMLTGRVPFDGESSQEIIMKHLTADPDLRGVPEPYASMIRKALVKDPARRFASAKEMLLALPAPAEKPVVVIDEYAAAPASAPVRAASEPMVIDEQTAEPEMMFGPLREHAIPVDVGGKGGRHAAAAQRQPARPAAWAGSSRCSAKSADEPIARAVQAGWRRFRDSFEDSRGGALLKIGVLCAVGLMLVANANVFFPLAIVLGILYLIYFGIRSLMLGDAATQRVWLWHRSRKQLLAHAQAVCRAKPLRVRAGELVGSLLASAMSCSLLSLLSLIMAARSYTFALEFVTLYVWLTLVTTLGTWLLLASGKWWEGIASEGSARRLIVMLMGAGLGVFAFWLAWFLHVDLRDISEAPRFDALRPNGWYDHEGNPWLPVFVVFFAALFAVPKWYRFVDPLRRHRVSIFMAILAGGWAWALHAMLVFTWPVGIMASVVMALSTQLASPWMNWRELPPTVAAAKEAHHAA